MSNSDSDSNCSSYEDDAFSDSDVIVSAAPTLLGLPRELFKMITDELDHEDGASLAHCSRYLYHHLRDRRYQAVVDTLEDEYKQGFLWCLVDAAPNQVGYAPFFITLPEYDPTEHPYLILTATFPEFDRYEDATETHSYLFIHMDLSGVWVDVSYWEPPKDDVHTTRKYGSVWERDMYTRVLKEESLDWEDVKGRLVRATRELLLKRFPCPECKGTEGVTSGSSELAARWPALVASGITIKNLPCPRCQGYDQAIRAKKAIEAKSYPYSSYKFVSWDNDELCWKLIHY